MSQTQARRRTPVIVPEKVWTYKEALDDLSAAVHRLAEAIAVSQARRGEGPLAGLYPRDEAQSTERTATQ